MKTQPAFIPPDHFTLGKFNTVSGVEIDINNVKPTDISIMDITIGLSNVCRWGGQIEKFYSVAQHSVMVSRLAPQELKMAALMHDASEAYLGDVISPLKYILGRSYKDIEMRFTQSIYTHFNIGIDEIKEVKEFDLKMLHAEHDAFRCGNMGMWDDLMFDLFDGRMTNIWSPSYAATKFYEEYTNLRKEAASE
jgi:hypothetical protein